MQRWLLYASLWAALLILCAGIALLLRTLPPTDLQSPDLWLTAVILLLSGVLFRWLYNRLLSLLDRLLFKDSYDYRASLQQLSRDLSLASDLDSLRESLSETLRRLMNLHFAAVMVPDESGSQKSGVAGSSDPALFRALGRAIDPAAREPRFVSVVEDEHPALIIPLLAGNALVGHLCLGPKVNGQPFRAVDRDLLMTLSGQVAALVRNAQLTDDLRRNNRTLEVLNDRLVRAREEERARLAADLHDEPLQTALYLDRQLRSMNGNASADSLSPVSRELTNQLCAIAQRMRPAALDDLGLPAALDMLVTDLQNRGEASIALDVDGQVLPSTLLPDVELTLYRVAQERLNNTLHHVEAHEVKVSLHTRGDFVALEVADDGKGFTVPNRLDRLALGGHLGLASLDQRVQHVGGRLVVVSAPGRGTTVRVELPLSEARL